MTPPTPNPRGRPRKYPLPSPTGNQSFQAPTHSNPGAQLPVSSTSILNTNTSTSTQPPPEKRMRAAQPDARAELLLAAARRVGKDRIFKVLDGAEASHLNGKDDPKPNAEAALMQPGHSTLSLQHSPTQAPMSHHESPSMNGTEPAAMRRGRQSRASISLPASAYHQFSQFLVEDSGRSHSGRGRSSKLRATKSAQEASRHAPESSKMADVRGTPRSPAIQTGNASRRAHTQQVVVAFTGDPQVDAQACLASFVAQYPGIHPVPVWSTTKIGCYPNPEDVHAPQTAPPTAAATTAADSGISGTVQVTPDRSAGDSRSKGLEHLLTAARTVLRARSQSGSPTPQRQLTSNSTLASPHHISTRVRHSPFPESHYTLPTSRRHSSPIPQSADSDTEPDEPGSPRGRPRVYSALDVLADQAAAVRTSSPDLPTDQPIPSPDLYEHLLQQSIQFPATPEPHATLLVPSNTLLSSSPMTAIPTSDPPRPSSSNTSPPTFDVTGSQRRALSEDPPQLAEMGIPESGQGMRQDETNVIEDRPMGVDAHWAPSRTQLPTMPSPDSHALRTPPRSEKLRGKQRACGGSA